MKKLFFFAAAMLAAVSMSAATITFDADTLNHKEAGAWSDGYIWANSDLVVTLNDPYAKIKVSANNCYFGDDQNQIKLQSRIQTGGKSDSKTDIEGLENTINITVLKAGKLSIAARTGSNGATDRNIVVKQNSSELINHVLLESEAIKVAGLDGKDPAKETNVYPILSCNVNVGSVEISYPVNGINIYAIAIGDIEAALGDVEAEGAKAVKKMIDGQLVIEKGGKLYNALGAEL